MDYDNRNYYGSQSHPQHSPYQQPPPISIRPPEPSQQRYPPSPYAADPEDGQEANFDFGFGGYAPHSGSQYPPQQQFHSPHHLPREMEYDSRRNSEIYPDHVSLGVYNQDGRGVYNQDSRYNSQTTLLPSPPRSQSPYAPYAISPTPYRQQQPYLSVHRPSSQQSASHQLPRGMGYDSRTNSEIYTESIPTGMYHQDSRYNSQTNLLPSASPSPYPGYHSPGHHSPGYHSPDYQSPVSSHTQLGSELELLRAQAHSPSLNKGTQPFGRELNGEKSSREIFSRDWVREGLIIQTAKRDDTAHMSRWKRWMFNTTPFWVLLSISTYWAYFTLRIYCTIQAQRRDRKTTFLMAYIFMTVELLIAIPTMLHLFMTLFILKPRKRPQLRLIGDDVPAVDVFITCCKEDTDLVLDTVRAACDIDYPVDRFRVVVLDDGRDTELQEECKRLRDTTAPNLFYKAREKIPGKPHHFKAGNLNYGFDEVKYLPGGAAQFAAALDADMIPEKNWLRALMPHMLVDRRMALACPPQLFYNTPREDPLSQSLDFFVHVLEGIKDALGVAWCTGSGYLLRREALEEIGWFPLGSLAEDVATSTLMLGKGWKTAFVHEPLQFGTVPDSFGSHLKQRTRWAIGTVDTALKLKFCLYGDAIARMTFFQRLSGFIYAVLAVFNVFTIVSLLALPIVLMSGRPLVAYVDEFQLRLLIWFCFAALLTNRITEIFISVPAGYSVGQNSTRAHFWMSPYIALTLVRAFILPKWLGGEAQSFKPTGSISSDMNERDAHRRVGIWTRLRVILFQYMAWWHLLYVYFCLVAITLSTSRCAFGTYDWPSRLRCLLTHAFWPPVSWILVCSAFWVPITYAIDPPTVPPREELLVRDRKTLVAHPKEEAKKVNFGTRRTVYELEYMAMTLFTCFIFVSAFIWL